MKLAFALAASILFGTGAYLVVHRDLVRVVLGIVTISQSAVLTLIASGITRGRAPIYPVSEGAVSDPLSQAMALTAIVIGLAMTSLLLVLVLRVVRAYRTDELDEMDTVEAEREDRLQRGEAGEHEAEEAAAR